ncbi:tRNA-dihydrouridine synthase, partial [Tribonema minus]
FYKAIGSPTYVAAPMVEQSEKAFRLLCRRHGCDLAYTQMLHAQQFSMLKAAKFRCVCCGGEDPQEDRPLIAQFCGNDPELLVKAARYVEHQVEACDLNLGCPQQIAKKGNYGAYLLPQGDLCERLIDAMASQLACPVTVKIRCLSTVEETVKLALRLEGAGVQLITVHGRTVRSAKTDNGPADWSIIREVKAALRIPVVANGGIETFADAERCLALTGADAIMSSEALLEDPALFDRSLPGLHEVSGAALAQRQLALAGEYLQLVQLYPPAIGAGPVRAHLFKMLHRLLGCHTDLRGRL